VKKTIRKLRQERGESETQLAEALCAMLQDIQNLERGIASPSVERRPTGQARASRQTPIAAPRAAGAAMRPVKKSVKNGADDVAGQGARLSTECTHSTPEVRLPHPPKERFFPNPFERGCQAAATVGTGCRQSRLRGQHRRPARRG
jgi:hypothetical protein